MLPRRLLSVLILALAALAATAGLSGASEPPESAAVDLPAGATSEPIVREWTGTIPQATTGAGTSTCTGRDDAEIDRHSVKINVPAGLYDRFTSQAKFTVQFDPGPLEQNDAVLTVINQDIEPAGSSGGTEGSESGEVGSSDNSDTAPEQVVGTNLAGATYEAQVCAYKNTGPVSYTARLEVTTAPVTPALPAAGAQGLAFSASVPADPQRDEGEPLIEIDGDGTIYTCGPTGASQAAEYAQVSTDDGQQFHLLGEPPRGQIAPGGGGDCSLATGFDRNAQGVFNLAYSGLGPLTNFATSKSADNGRSFQGSPISGQTVPGVDRQWQTFLDADTVLLSYNQQQPRQIVVQKSDDGGLTYGLRVPATATDPSFPGPMRSMENPAPGDQPRIAYFSWNAGTDVNLAVSFDGAETWKNCRLAKSAGEPTLFTTSDNDRDGNIYVAYGENATFHTYMTALPVANLNNCDQGTDKFPDKDPGVLAPVQVDRAGVSSSLFAWLTAGGEPGRVAVGFYGTATDGDPNLGTFKASWNVYVNQSVNALAPDATFSQVQATTHPIHYDSICLNGLGCDVGGGDRSLSDFFAIDYSPRSGKIHVVYDTAYKVPGEAQGVIATPTVFSQIGGPSLGGGAVDRAKSPEPLRDVSDDPADDAISDYSTLDSPNAPTKQPAADFRNVALAPPDGKGGVTVTMKLADLSDAALQQALQSGSNGTTPATRLIWIFRWFNGYRSAAAVAKYDPAQGFSTGFNGFETGSAQCGGSGSKCLQYTGSQPIEGKVDQKA
ncbi:MAG TPA: sialidase family protein, partial [Solirubrobacteraceae bacterium]